MTPPGARDGAAWCSAIAPPWLKPASTMRSEGIPRSRSRSIRSASGPRSAGPRLVHAAVEIHAQDVVPGGHDHPAVHGLDAGRVGEHEAHRVVRGQAELGDDEVVALAPSPCSHRTAASAGRPGSRTTASRRGARSCGTQSMAAMRQCNPLDPQQGDGERVRTRPEPRGRGSGGGRAHVAGSRHSKSS